MAGAVQPSGAGQQLARALVAAAVADGATATRAAMAARTAAGSDSHAVGSTVAVAVAGLVDLPWDVVVDVHLMAARRARRVTTTLAMGRRAKESR